MLNTWLLPATDLWHNSCLGTGINESLDLVAVDFAVDVEHDDGSKALGVVLHRKLHVVLYVVALNFLTKNIDDRVVKTNKASRYNIVKSRLTRH